MRGVIFLMASTVALSACAGDETKVVLSTNDVVAVAQRVQCHSVTKSGNRCKRKAAPGKLYCRQHAAQSPAAKPSETCAYISDDGKRCTVSAASGSRFCAKHQDK
jgi:hypothetical protein